MNDTQPTHICYVVKTNNFEPYYHLGQKIEAVETKDRVPFGRPILMLCHGMLYFGYVYPSNKIGYAALMDGNRQITYIKRYHIKKRYLVIER